MSETSQPFDPTSGVDMIQKRDAQKRGFDDSDEHSQRGGIEGPDIEIGKDLARELRTADRDPEDIFNEAIDKHMIADNRDGTFKPLTQGGETLLDTHQRLLNEAADSGSKERGKDPQPAIPTQLSDAIGPNQPDQEITTSFPEKTHNPEEDAFQARVKEIISKNSADRFADPEFMRQVLEVDSTMTQDQLLKSLELFRESLEGMDLPQKKNDGIAINLMIGIDKLIEVLTKEGFFQDKTEESSNPGPPVPEKDSSQRRDTTEQIDTPDAAHSESVLTDRMQMDIQSVREGAFSAKKFLEKYIKKGHIHIDAEGKLTPVTEAGKILLVVGETYITPDQGKPAVESDHAGRGAADIQPKVDLDPAVGTPKGADVTTELPDDAATGEDDVDHPREPDTEEEGVDPVDPNQAQTERESQVEVAHEQMEGEEQAVINEAIANDKILESRFGQELNAKIDALKITIDTCRPRGKWEKAVYFFGGGGEKAEKYKEAKEVYDQLESRYNDWQKIEVDYLRQGEKVQQLLEDVAGFQEEKNNQEDSLADLELQLSQLEQDRDQAQTPEEREYFERQVAEKASQIAEVRENIRDLSKKIESARKDALKITLGLHKDRSYLETKLLPDIQVIADIETEIPIEEGASRLFTKKEIMEDYSEKEKLIEVLDKIIEDPSSEEAQFLIDWLKGRILGAEDEQGDDIQSPKHRAARIMLRALDIGPMNLDAKHLEEFLKKESGESIRIAAQKARERLMIDGKLESRSSAIRGDIKQFRSREIFDLLDMQIMAEKGEKAAKIGVKKAYAAARFIQNWWHLPISGAKQFLAFTVGHDMRSERYQGIDYETRTRDIIEEGSNEIALTIQSGRLAIQIASPRNLGTLTSPIFMLEKGFNWPFERIFKRSESIRLWTQKLQDRQNNSARKVSERVDAVMSVMNDLNTIRRRKRERNREGERPTLGRRIHEGAGAAGRRAAAEASNAGRQARGKARELSERGFDYVDDILAKRTNRRREKRAAKEQRREQRRKNKGGDKNAG